MYDYNNLPTDKIIGQYNLIANFHKKFLAKF